MSRLAAIGLAAAIVATAVAQERPLVFQVGAELVVLDMMAVGNSSGRDVGDLKRVRDPGRGGWFAAAGAAAAADQAPRARPTAPCRSIRRRRAGATSPAASPMPDGTSLIIAVDLNSIAADAIPRVNAAILDLLGAGARTRLRR